MIYFYFYSSRKQIYLLQLCLLFAVHDEVFHIGAAIGDDRLATQTNDDRGEDRALATCQQTVWWYARRHEDKQAERIIDSPRISTANQI